LNYIGEEYQLESLSKAVEENLVSIGKEILSGIKPCKSLKSKKAFVSEQEKTEKQ
jgi:hypothetical protein